MRWGDLFLGHKKIDIPTTRHMMLETTLSYQSLTSTVVSMGHTRCTIWLQSVKRTKVKTKIEKKRIWKEETEMGWVWHNLIYAQLQLLNINCNKTSIQLKLDDYLLFERTQTRAAHVKHVYDLSLGLVLNKVINCFGNKFLTKCAHIIIF